jgi:hypothetical protein
VIGLVIERKKPKVFQSFGFPVAAGVIAGEGLMGVALAFGEHGPAMVRQIFGG